ncbi:MAG: LodA/GoxA family CTQ-dependent oxidase [Planctomycetota bacterium]
MAGFNYRIHPAIGIARVGNSNDFYLGPETMAGTGRTGGLPIRPGTEETTITSSDVRDSAGAFKRQAARFKIYQYPEQTGPESYPIGLPPAAVQEIKIGSKVGGKTVANIIWTVHVANKKANTFVLIEDADLTVDPPVYEGICGFDGSNLPPIRNWTGANLQEGPKTSVLNDPARVKALTIDPGPRTISGPKAAAVAFDRATPATCCSASGQVTTIGNYPKSFPADSFSNPAKPGQPGLECPAGPIDTLGELQTDEFGRLLVLGGYGRACGWNPQSQPPVAQLPNNAPLPFGGDVNNNQWFDDASDGPVTAVIVFDDKSVQEVQAGAWVVTTDPSYAPQTLNVVSLFDDMYDSWVRKLQLAPQILPGNTAPTCKAGNEQLPSDWFTKYNSSYKPSFDDQVNPIFQSVALQKWNINLNATPGISGHDTVGKITAKTDPASTPLQNLSFIRIPGESGNGQQQWDQFNPLMPASLGDANQSFLTVTPTQYFFLNQWASPPTSPSSYSPPPLGPGERLDKAVLVNCLGGRFSPGIDLTFIVRQPEMYITDWQTSGTGPFRIKPAPLNYGQLPSGGQPLLTQGYIPLHTGNAGLEPGDVSKFMAIPWHTDYNSCATHLPSSNPADPPNTVLFWSWPAQRPVAVYVAKEVKDNGGLMKNGVPVQQWSVRGTGTGSSNTPAQDWGRYQKGNVVDMLTNWPKIGLVMNATAIDTSSDGAPLPARFADYYLEAQSQLVPAAGEPPVVPFPNLVDQKPNQ